MTSGFFALLDDIAVLMDDVATMSKVATRQTAGVLVDDLAVNADKASGFVSSRELPILWKITKGSFINKLIILPVSFLLSAYLPIAIVPILLIGGIYLAYEGAEKIYEYLFHKKKAKGRAAIDSMSEDELLKYEKKKIKAAILVDFILSIEIIIIALGTVVEQPIIIQIFVVTIIAILATIGVYGIVALLVRMDDVGYKLISISKSDTSFYKHLGTSLVKALPYIIRTLSFIGTLAMILVAGGIFSHNVEFVHHLIEMIPKLLGEFIIGLIIGSIAVLVLKIFSKLSYK